VPRRARKSRLARLASVVGSYGTAVVLLLLLLVLTLLGTLEQRHASLYDVQRRYFESLIVVHHVGDVPIPLPGASLVIGLLAGNLLVGGVIRLRKGIGTLGILIAHLGILTLFLGGLVETIWSRKGQLTLGEGDSGDRFHSYFEWDLVVRERLAETRTAEVVVPSDRLEGLSPADVAKFTSSSWPFDLKLTGWSRNSEPEEVGQATGGGDVEGWILRAKDLAMEAERNQPGAYATLVPKDGSPAIVGILWGGQRVPWVVDVGGRRFEIDLLTHSWSLPFQVTLKRFVHEEHPGTTMAKEFSSYVTMHERGADRDVHITMNQPLRHEGYTLYQSSWGPPNASPGAKLFSTFSVVTNPSDKLPIWACSIIAAGLLVHFAIKLSRYLRAEARSPRAPGKEAA
jgi:hypothetical protein